MAGMNRVPKRWATPGATALGAVTITEVSASDFGAASIAQVREWLGGNFTGHMHHPATGELVPIDISNYADKPGTYLRLTFRAYDPAMAKIPPPKGDGSAYTDTM